MNYRKNLNFSKKGNEILDNHSVGIGATSITKGENDVEASQQNSSNLVSYNKFLPKTGERGFLFLRIFRLDFYSFKCGLGVSNKKEKH